MPCYVCHFFGVVEISFLIVPWRRLFCHLGLGMASLDAVFVAPWWDLALFVWVDLLMMLLVFRHERGKFDCVANSFSSCFWDVAVIASEMVHGWSNVKASHSMVGPCATFLWSFVHYDFASWWRHWRFSKLKIPHSWLYAESLGFMREGRTMFRVITVWLINLSHWFAGNSGSQPCRTETKWF